MSSKDENKNAPVEERDSSERFVTFLLKFSIYSDLHNKGHLIM